MKPTYEYKWLNMYIYEYWTKHMHPFIWMKYLSEIFFTPNASNKKLTLPGGPTTILAWAGKDATKFFNEIHKGVKSHGFD